jgi:hypothetical protein
MQNVSQGGVELKKDFIKGFFSWFVGILHGLAYQFVGSGMDPKMLLSDEFRKASYMIRLGLSLGLSIARTMRYPFAWMCADGTYEILGIEHVRWLSFSDLRFLPGKFWSAGSVAQMVSRWNPGIHMILKETVHVRLLVMGLPRFIGEYCAFISSAFWHGLFSGYYVLGCGHALIAALDGYRIEMSAVIGVKSLGRWVSWVVGCVCAHVLNFWISAPWDLYWAGCYWDFYKATLFGPLLVLIALDAIGFVLVKLKQTSKGSRRPSRIASVSGHLDNG